MATLEQARALKAGAVEYVRSKGVSVSGQVGITTRQGVVDQYAILIYLTEVPGDTSTLPPIYEGVALQYTAQIPVKAQPSLD